MITTEFLGRFEDRKYSSQTADLQPHRIRLVARWNQSLALCFALSVLTLVVCSRAQAQSSTITTFDGPTPCTTTNGTFPQSINSTGVITGYCRDASSANHGFFGTPSSFTEFDVPAGLLHNGLKQVLAAGGPLVNTGTTFATFAQSINDSGEITGDYQPMSGSALRGFIRLTNGSFTAFDAPGATNGTVPLSINASGVITGYYSNDSGHHGFLTSDGVAITTFDVQTGIAGTTPQSINSAGQIVGWWTDDGSITHGFERSADGTTYTSFDAPGTGTTNTFATSNATQSNSNDAITGYYTDNNGTHGFVTLDGGTTITTFDVMIGTAPAAVTHPVSINGSGAVAGFYRINVEGPAAGFFRDPSGNITTFDVPTDTNGTQPTSINASNVITGHWTDANNQTHGFLFTSTLSTTVTLTFTPGTLVSQTAVFNCPSGMTPCPDPEANSINFKVTQVTSTFTITVTAFYVPITEANGDCEVGQTDATDFDCRFTQFFPIGPDGSGGTIVPQCDAYFMDTGGNRFCVFYRVDDTGVPSGAYQGPVYEYVAWNDAGFIPPPTYAANNPRLYDDPNIFNIPSSLQFEFDITSYYNPNGQAGGPDPGVGGTTKKFNDFVVAFPAALPNPPYKFTLFSPSPFFNTFEQDQFVPIIFSLKQGKKFISNAVTPPNVVNYAVLDSNGIRQPVAPAGQSPPTFTYSSFFKVYYLFLPASLYAPGTYTLHINSNLFTDQTGTFTIIPEDSNN